MTPSVFPGGWYCDALPTGEFVVLVPGVHLLTHRGVIPLPPGETFGPLFVRCTNVGNFRFAGQAHDSIEPACWEWIDGIGWKSYQQPCVGVSPVIYDWYGVLHRSDGSVGSQGFRYLDRSKIISGDESYGPFNGLFEYSKAGDLYIGQGATDGSGVRVWDNGTLRQLELGDGRFVRVNVVGERVAIAWMQSVGSVIVWTTLRELRALPPVTVAPPPPPPPPEKAMLPNPQQVKDALDRELKKFSVINNVMLGKVLNAVALQFPGMGMHRKDGEKSAPQPVTGIGMARDILRFLPPGDDIGFWSDVLGATGAGMAIPLAPEWKVSNDDSRSFVKPVIVDVDPPVDPPPVDPPPSSDVNARLTALEGAVLRIRTQLHSV